MQPSVHNLLRGASFRVTITSNQDNVALMHESVGIALQCQYLPTDWRDDAQISFSEQPSSARLFMVIISGSSAKFHGAPLNPFVVSRSHCILGQMNGLDYTGEEI